MDPNTHRPHRGVLSIEWERSESSLGWTIASNPEIENEDLAELFETILATLRVS